MFELGRGCFSSRRSSLALPSLATTKDGRGFTVSELYLYNSLQISSIWPEFGHAISSRWNLVRLKSIPVTSRFQSASLREFHFWLYFLCFLFESEAKEFNGEILLQKVKKWYRKYQKWSIIFFLVKKRA